MPASRLTDRSRGAQLAERLRRGCRGESSALKAGARTLSVLQGVTSNCEFYIPQENVLAALGDILVASKSVYIYGRNIYMLQGEGEAGKLVALTTGKRIEPHAVGMLANVVVCQVGSNESDKKIQFPLPRRLVDLILNHEPTLARLPVIDVYASRPLFDRNYCLRGPGWHPDVNYMIHSREVEPHIRESIPVAENPLDRLPPRLRELLREFCFRSASDLVNAVGALLTGILVNLFISFGKAAFILDGNQPSVGKTLFARVLATLFDGREPAPIEYSANDEELGKRICATLRGNRPSVILIDNCKLKGGFIESAVLEANTTSPRISLRILGQSVNYEQPNDVLWLMTMNNTRLGQDLTERSCPIRFFYEGDPKTRRLSRRDLIDFVKRNRNELLGELAGMILFWNEEGRPEGTAEHRLAEWSRTIGGILDANGLPGFLANLAEAAADFNVDLDQLASLAEAVLRLPPQSNQPPIVRFVGSLETESPAPSEQSFGSSAGGLQRVFSETGVLREKLSEITGQRGIATAIGTFLSRLVNRPARVLDPRSERNGTTVLRTATRRGAQKVYFFDVCWDATPEGGGDAPPTEICAPHTGESAPQECDTSEAPRTPTSGSAPAAEGGNELDW